MTLTLALISGFAAFCAAGAEAPAGAARASTVELQSTKTPPVIIRRVEPQYTPEARRARIQGIVEIEIDIDAGGVVTDARILKSLDHTFGLDAEALSSARRWLFRPATVDGKAVPFTATVQMEFRQHDTPKAEPKAAPNAEAKTKAKPAKDDEQKSGPVVVAPVVLKRVDPKYTPEAMRAKIQGTVTLLVTIDANGVVTGATVAESLDAEHGLDNSAIAAVMQWSFRPGTIDGVAKAFDVKISMEFRLH
jgi:TonB family protein